MIWNVGNELKAEKMKWLKKKINKWKLFFNACDTCRARPEWYAYTNVVRCVCDLVAYIPLTFFLFVIKNHVHPICDQHIHTAKQSTAQHSTVQHSEWPRKLIRNTESAIEKQWHKNHMNAIFRSLSQPCPMFVWNLYIVVCLYLFRVLFIPTTFWWSCSCSLLRCSSRDLVADRCSHPIHRSLACAHLLSAPNNSLAHRLFLHSTVRSLSLFLSRRETSPHLNCNQNRDTHAHIHTNIVARSLRQCQLRAIRIVFSFSLSLFFGRAYVFVCWCACITVACLAVRSFVRYAEIFMVSFGVFLVSIEPLP